MTDRDRCRQDPPSRTETSSACSRPAKPRIREVIVVEGRYDRNTLSQVVDAMIFETGGFAIFNSPSRLCALRTLAARRGLIILTDSDGAGFVIRNRLKSLLPSDCVRQAFIPAVPGKERRKDHPSRQGLLGVEGMRPEVLLDALRLAGATEEEPVDEFTAADFLALGLTGCPGSALLRRRLAESLNLPGDISQSDLRRTVSRILSAEELSELVSELSGQPQTD